MDTTARRNLARAREYRSHVDRTRKAFFEALDSGRSHLSAGRLDEAERDAVEAQRLVSAISDLHTQQVAVDALVWGIEHARGDQPRGDVAVRS